MILFNTQYEEIIRALKNEEEKVQFFMRKEGNKIAREIESGHAQSMKRFCTYEIPSSRNRYFVYFFATSTQTMIDISKGSLLIVNDDKGNPTYLTLESYIFTTKNVFEKHTEILHVYTGHFFSRYRERNRMPEGMSNEELIATYIRRNWNYTAVLNHEQMIKNQEKYKDAICLQNKEGFSFGTQKEVKDSKGNTIRVIRHNTFLAPETLKSSQIEKTLPPDILEQAIQLLNNLKK